MTVRFELVDDIEAPVERVFELAASIDLHLQSFAHSGEQAIGGVTSGLIGLGETVTWRAKHFGITWVMTSRITELEKPVRFTDEQLKGPFKQFRHVHLFEAVGGSCRMTDHVSFDAPFGIIGRAVERLVLARYLKNLIVLRNAHLKRAAEGLPAGSQPAPPTEPDDDPAPQ